MTTSDERVPAAGEVEAKAGPPSAEPSRRCDRCRFSLTGAPVGDGRVRCPECGATFLVDHLDHRTAFQRRPNPWAWIRTAWATTVHPRWVVPTVSMHARASTYGVNVFVLLVLPVLLAAPACLLFWIPLGFVVLWPGYVVALLLAAWLILPRTLREPRWSEVAGHALFPAIAGVVAAFAALVVGLVVALAPSIVPGSAPPPRWWWWAVLLAPAACLGAGAVRALWFLADARTYLDRDTERIRTR